MAGGAGPLGGFMTKKSLMSLFVRGVENSTALRTTKITSPAAEVGDLRASMVSAGQGAPRIPGAVRRPRSGLPVEAGLPPASLRDGLPLPPGGSAGAQFHSHAAQETA